MCKRNLVLNVKLEEHVLKLNQDEDIKVYILSRTTSYFYFRVVYRGTT